VAGVMIGIDPHKGSHTAVALDAREQRLGHVRVRASGRQADGLPGHHHRHPAALLNKGTPDPTTEDPGEAADRQPTLQPTAATLSRSTTVPLDQLVVAGWIRV
jgi:hypothetical protein